MSISSDFIFSRCDSDVAGAAVVVNITLLVKSETPCSCFDLLKMSTSAVPDVSFSTDAVV